MKTVEHLLQAKSGDIWCIGPADMVLDAIKLMAEKEVGALLVRDGETVVGIVSERDYARKVILRGRAAKETPVSEIMTTGVIFASPEQTVQQCLEMMTDKRIRHLPVMSGGRLVGMISIGDLVKAIITDQQEMIEQLETYIRG
jgi:CBS domain-containing protein